MTGTKLWRISLAAILGFGWLFLTPAYSNDPLSLAFEEINQLKSKSQNLNYKTDLLELISISEEKYYTAESFKSIFEESFALYNAAVEQNNIAIQEKSSAQIAVNNQISIVSEAQNNLDIASINLTTAQVQYPVQGTPGLNAYLYDCWTPSGSYNNSPPLGCNTNPISMGPWINMSWNFGGGGPAGLYDDYQIRLSGYIKQTQHWTPQFRTCGDDGMTISINGNVVVNDWYDRGGGCGISNGYYMNSNEWVPIEIWWYENGGGANGNAQWNIGNGFVTIPSSVLSTEIPYIAPELIAAQENYNNKLSIYNQEVQILQTLQSNLTLAEQNLTLTEQNLTSSLTAKNNAETDYNNAIIDLNNSIDLAWEYYYSQLQRELQIAISQALNNQPKPEITPEPNTTIEPSPEPEPTIAPSPNPTPQPSPEQSEPVVPTPEPSSDTTNEPKPEPSSDPQPTPEPSQEPSPQPTDIGPSPSPEPEPTPDKPSSKPAQPNNITEETANLIADLTNKDTLTKLNSEQKAAVAEALGIKSEEIATIVELAKTNEAVAKALEEFSDRAEENVDAPMPYTLADATTEIAAEQFLSNPIGAITNIDLDKVLSPSEWGKDMTDDQREKAQEVIVPVIIASNLVAAAMTRRI